MMKTDRDSESIVRMLIRLLPPNTREAVTVSRLEGEMPTPSQRYRSECSQAISGFLYPAAHGEQFQHFLCCRYVTDSDADV